MAKAKTVKFVNDPQKSRLFFDCLQAIRGYTPNEISKLCKKRAKGDKRKQVSVTTIVKWFIPINKGGTKYPSSRTIENAILAVGGSITINPPAKKEEKLVVTKQTKKKNEAGATMH